MYGSNFNTNDWSKYFSFNDLTNMTIYTDMIFAHFQRSEILNFRKKDQRNTLALSLKVYKYQVFCLQSKQFQCNNIDCQ